MFLTERRDWMGLFHTRVQVLARYPDRFPGLSPRPSMQVPLRNFKVDHDLFPPPLFQFTNHSIIGQYINPAAEDVLKSRKSK
jgi:hypothetical protein